MSKIVSKHGTLAPPSKPSIDITVDSAADGVLSDTPTVDTSIITQSVAAPTFTIIYIDPTAGYGGNGTLADPYNSWYAFTLQPGDIALQRGGTVTEGFTITAQGTASQPIVIGSYGTGMAQIVGTVVLDGASNVTLTGLDIVGGDEYDVMLTGNTSSSVIQNSNLHGGVGGVLVNGATSNSNVIANNQIYDNDTNGITFDGANASPTAQSLVIGNTIYRNGEQGISLRSSYVIVNGNTIVNNGLSGLPGLSAIHVYADSATDTSGQNNVISGNVIADQYDPSSFDGNGVQLDAWSGNNAVVNNQIFGNDGSGISVLSSGNNLVANNTLQDNVVDSGGTHVISHADIYLGTAVGAPGLTTGNIITGNTILATNPYESAVQVDASVTSDPTDVITGNGMESTSGAPLWIWGTETGNTVAGWNGLSRTGSDSALSGAPAAPPTFASSMLDRTFTMNSNTFLVPNENGISMLVAYGPNLDVIGGPDGNWIAGDGQDNTLLAGGGDNLVAAGSGNVTILGQAGNDIYFGGSGNDMMFAGSGNTVMVGGSGNSQMVAGSGNDVIFAGNGTGTDTLGGGTGNNSLVGGDGVDTFVLGSGVEFITNFAASRDFINVSDFNVTGFSQLEIVGASGNTAIADPTGTIHAVLEGTTPQQLTAANFIFTPTS